MLKIQMTLYQDSLLANETQEKGERKSCYLRSVVKMLWGMEWNSSVKEFKIFLTGEFFFSNQVLCKIGVYELGMLADPVIQAIWRPGFEMEFGKLWTGTGD